MTRRNNDDRAANPLKAQIIADTRGEPAFVVLPIEGFAVLLAWARKGRASADEEPQRDSPHSAQQKKQFAFSEQLFEQHLAGVGKDKRSEVASFLKSYESILSGARNWLQFPDDSPCRPAGEDGESKDAEDVAAYDAALARDEESFSAEVADRLIAGDTPLKVFREHRGLTQRQLADKADTAAAYVSQIETGRRAGSIAMLRRLAHALDLEIDDLI